jgi:hypothetical protein
MENVQASFVSPIYTHTQVYYLGDEEFSSIPFYCFALTFKHHYIISYCNVNVVIKTAWSLPLSRNKVKYVWSYNSSPTICLQGMVLNEAQEELHLLLYKRVAIDIYRNYEVTVVNGYRN